MNQIKSLLLVFLCASVTTVRAADNGTGASALVDTPSAIDALAIPRTRQPKCHWLPLAQGYNRHARDVAIKRILKTRIIPSLSDLQRKQLAAVVADYGIRIPLNEDGMWEIDPETITPELRDIITAIFCPVNELNEHLWDHIMLGNVISSSILLSRGANPNTRTQHNPMDEAQSLLLAACKFASPEIAQQLIHYGANVLEIVDEYSQNTILHKICMFDETQCIEVLVRNGLSIDVQNNRGNTPLHLACEGGHLDIVQKLLRLHANVNTTNNDNDTPLHTACRYDNTDIVALLLRHGANPAATNNQNETALHLAVFNGKEAIVRLLLAHPSATDTINAVDAKNETPLLLANRNIVIAELLLQHGANPEFIRDPSINWTCLHEAIIAGAADREFAKLLIRYGANVRAEDALGRSVISRACQYDEQELVRILLYNHHVSPPVHIEFTPPFTPGIEAILSEYRQKQRKSDFGQTEIPSDNGSPGCSVM